MSLKKGWGMFLKNTPSSGVMILINHILQRDAYTSPTANGTSTAQDGVVLHRHHVTQIMVAQIVPYRLLTGQPDATRDFWEQPFRRDVATPIPKLVRHHRQIVQHARAPRRHGLNRAFPPAPMRSPHSNLTPPRLVSANATTPLGFDISAPFVFLDRTGLKAETRARTNDEIMPAWSRKTGD